MVCNKGPYIVFFDWDKSDITPEAATILDSAITAYGNCNSVPIMLAGHTDRSGTPKYNMGLSSRRNDSVRAYLSSHGIPDGAISSQAFGETQPRVPTADGVREPAEPSRGNHLRSGFGHVSVPATVNGLGAERSAPFSLPTTATDCLRAKLKPRSIERGFNFE